jgi:hypothetical protein
MVQRYVADAPSVLWFQNYATIKNLQNNLT